MDGQLRHRLELFAAVEAVFFITYLACAVLNLTTWAKNFLVVIQAVYMLPVLMFLAHYSYQYCFIGMAYRNFFLRRPQNVNLSRVASLNAVVNLVMLVHLVRTFVVTYKTSPQELLEVSWLMLLELAFRLVGLVMFLYIYMYYQQTKSFVKETKPQTDYGDHNTSLVFTVPPPSSLVKEEAQRAVFHLN